MNIEKLVSVIIPTYKRPDTLSRAIDSVLNQSYKNIEIIVVDDNDSMWEERTMTEKVMESYSYSSLKYIKHNVNKNGSAARNTGFSYSKGDYIMFLDDDDEFTKHKVEKQVKRLDSLDETWGACYTGYVRKKNGKVVVRSGEKREGSLLSEELMRNLFVHAGSNLMIRREVVEEVKGFDETFKRNQDVEFLSRILISYKLAYVDMVGLVVHIHDRENSNRNFEKITSEYLNKFENIIKKLPETEESKIYKMIELQLFRHYITTSGKRHKIIQQINKKRVSIRLIIKYLLHLFNRKLTGKAYGFKI